jgi:hypothetical protein
LPVCQKELIASSGLTIMPKSEIDEIFASKGKIQPKPTKKDKKRKRRTENGEKPPAPDEKAPETIIDPSASLPAAKRVKVSKSTEKTSQTSSKKDIDKFKDSRGSGPRRKTEEGWSIYKADELGIKDDDEGGDTPLCPFDCDCCF